MRKRFTFWLNDEKSDESALIGQVDHLKQKRSFSKTIRDGIRLITSLSSGSMDVLFELFPFVRAEFLQYVESLQINSENGEKKTLTAQNENLQKRVIELETENATLRERNIGLQAVLAEDDQHIAELEAELDKQTSHDTSAIEAKIDRLEKLLIQQGYKPEQPQSTKSSQNSGVGLKGAPTGASGGIGLKGLSSANSQLSAPIFDDDDLPELNITKSKDAGTNANKNLINGLLGLQNS